MYCTSIMWFNCPNLFDCRCLSMCWKSILHYAILCMEMFEYHKTSSGSNYWRARTTSGCHTIMHHVYNTRGVCQQCNKWIAAMVHSIGHSDETHYTYLTRNCYFSQLDITLDENLYVTSVWSKAVALRKEIWIVREVIFFHYNFRSISHTMAGILY